MWPTMKRILKLIVHHPIKLWLGLVALGAIYGYARVLVLQHALGALRHSILRYPRNFPHAFFLPFFYGGLTLAFFGAIYHDLTSLPASGAWKYVLPMPLAVQGRLYRVLGVPVVVLALGIAEAVQVFRNPSMKSDLGHLAAYLEVLRDRAFVDERTLRAILWDVKWQAWTLRTTDPTTFAYVRLPLEILLALVVCVTYGVSLFCREPRHDGEELREATRNNDHARVRVILGRGVHPDARGSDGSTALHICAQQAMIGIAQVLLEHKADPNATDRLGFTPLHWAVQMRREEVSTSNRLELIKLLVKDGGDPLRGDARGRSPLSIARKKENGPALEVLRELLGSRVDEEPPRSDSSTDTVE